MAHDPLREVQAEGERLQEAIDAEYRSARRENTWGRTQPQILERWRAALRGWTLATEAALAAAPAALNRFRAGPSATAADPAESADWIEVRNALAGKRAALSALVDSRNPAAAPAGSPRRAGCGASAGVRPERQTP